MKYAYVDESGTREFQKVMAVSLVVLEGRRTAEKLHENIMRAIYPDFVNKRRLIRRDATGKLPQLHYQDMNRAQKERVAKFLASASVSAYVCYFYHQAEASGHNERFEIYTHLVKDAIRLATEHHRELSVVVAQQGGWQGYEQRFSSELRGLEFDQTHEGRTYRKLAITLSPASHPGIQLADFYAGACRSFVLNPDNEVGIAHFRCIERQTRLELSAYLAAD